MKLTNENVNNELFKEFPELTDEYKKYIDWWSGADPGLHNIFGDILNPFILNLLKINENKNSLIKIFNFLEQMAESPDIDVENVLTVTVLERIGDDKNILNTAQKYMGQSTRKLSDEIEKYWGRM